MVSVWIGCRGQLCSSYPMNKSLSSLQVVSAGLGCGCGRGHVNEHTSCSSPNGLPVAAAAALPQ
eukprot:2767431-Pleurochrysis_carterae.AAC.1